MPTEANSYFYNKKTMVQFTLSLLVFFIHFQVFSVYRGSDLLNRIFVVLNPLTHVAVPLFFMISGALFYRNYNLSLTTKKWKKRFITLCVPYLVWNAVWYVLALLGNYTPLGIFLGGVKATFSLDSFFNGILLYGYFEPFWFILQLIVLTVFCPIIYILIKNKSLGLITIGVIYILCCLKICPENVFISNPNMILPYLIGSYIGIHHDSLFISKRSKRQALVAWLSYAVCCLLYGLKHMLPEWCSNFQLPLLVTIISCLAFWVAFDSFDTTQCPRYMSNSFLIYALHSFVGAALSKIIYIIMPDGQLFSLLTAIIAFPSTIIIICIFGSFLEKHCPALKLLLTGK